MCYYSVVYIKPNWWVESDLQGMDKLNENHSAVTSTSYFNKLLEWKVAYSLAGTGLVTCFGFVGFFLTKQYVPG